MPTARSTRVPGLVGELRRQRVAGLGTVAVENRPAGCRTRAPARSPARSTTTRSRRRPGPAPAHARRHRGRPAGSPRAADAGKRRADGCCAPAPHGGTRRPAPRRRAGLAAAAATCSQGTALSASRRAHCSVETSRQLGATAAMFDAHASTARRVGRRVAAGAGEPRDRLGPRRRRPRATLRRATRRRRRAQAASRPQLSPQDRCRQRGCGHVGIALHDQAEDAQPIVGAGLERARAGARGRAVRPRRSAARRLPRRLGGRPLPAHRHRSARSATSPLALRLGRRPGELLGVGRRARRTATPADGAGPRPRAMRVAAEPVAGGVARTVARGSGPGRRRHREARARSPWPRRSARSRDRRAGRRRGRSSGAGSGCSVEVGSIAGFSALRARQVCAERSRRNRVSDRH